VREIWAPSTANASVWSVSRRRGLCLLRQVEKRKVYVMEGISKLPQYTYGKRILYIDAEAWWC